MNLEDNEFNKFTQQSQVKITGFAANKIVNTYDVNGSLTLSQEYTANRQLTYIDITNGILNNTSIRIYAQDGTSYYIWFNVNGAGVDPALPGTPIPVAITSSDLPAIKVAAIVTAVNNVAGTKLKAKLIGTYIVSIAALVYGTCSASADIDSLLTITNKITGSDYTLVAEIQLTYDVNGNMTTAIRLEH